MAAENVTLHSAQSMAANANGSPVAVDGLRYGNVEVIWSGADDIDGDVKLQMSLKPAPGVNDWADVPGKNVTLDAAAGAKFLDLGTLRANWIRLVYSKNSNTAGSVTVLGRLTDY